jgi:hypothetical protein
MTAKYDIYEQHRKAFANVSAYAIMDHDEMVATIAFKYPRNDMGRLYTYVQWVGVEMVRGAAGGCGYDKHSAALRKASDKMPMQDGEGRLSYHSAERSNELKRALSLDDGYSWQHNLEKAGFTVLQTV